MRSKGVFGFQWSFFSKNNHDGLRDWRALVGLFYAQWLVLQKRASHAFCLDFYDRRGMGHGSQHDATHEIF